MAAPVTIAGRFELPDNTPLEGGTMTFTLVPADIPDTVEPVVVLPGPVIVPIDETGAFTVTVRATDDPDLVAHVDGDLVYRVWRSTNGTSARYTVAVPSPGPVGLDRTDPGTRVGCCGDRRAAARPVKVSRTRRPSGPGAGESVRASTTTPSG